MTQLDCIAVENAVPSKPRLDNVIPLTKAKAARVEERNSYVVTGYVLTHQELAKKAIVDMAAVRWFPNVDEFMFMMSGRKVTPGPGTPPPGWGAEELLNAVPAPATVLGAPASSRPILTAPPSARLLDSTEAALSSLAGELGCVRNDDIPHNAGWFVPGRAIAYASAYDAIRGLVASLLVGGTIYRPETKASTASLPPDPIAVPARPVVPTQLESQGALF